MQERALARPVRTDEHDELGRCDVEIDVRKDGRIAATEPDAARFENGGHSMMSSFRRDNSRYKKNGAPSVAVMTPRRMSAGAATVRQRRSVPTTNAAPKRRHAGSSTAWLGPTTRRRTCGTTSPTNAMTPATATAPPITSEVAMIKRRLTAGT